MQVWSIFSDTKWNLQREYLVGMYEEYDIQKKDQLNQGPK